MEVHPLQGLTHFNLDPESTGGRQRNFYCAEYMSPLAFFEQDDYTPVTSFIKDSIDYLHRLLVLEQSGSGQTMPGLFYNGL
ncbi:MAG: hypothetical protein C0523_01025 [Cytophaga sp.]|nr:hypothetical protein [Cytophaga sp.]